VFADPYHGLETRSRHPERALFLSTGTQVLVSVGYVYALESDHSPSPQGRVIASAEVLLK